MATNIVPTNINYNSYILRQNLRILNLSFPFLNIQDVGRSVLGQNIPVIKLGKGPKKVFYSASIHANEWITSVLLMKFIEDYCNSYVENSRLYGYSVRSLYKNASIYIMPMVNPDGVNLVTGALPRFSQAYQKAQQISLNYPSITFTSGWKANINGVDLNLQFPAGWKDAKRIKYSQGYTSPAPRDFVGFGPLTEPEALAIYDFTLSHKFELVISYHTQGKEIYWQFQKYTSPDAFAIGKRFAAASDYTLANTPYNSSFAGYKDWFIQKYQKPGYTVESGKGINPLPLSQFPKIYSDNIGILVLGAVL